MSREAAGSERVTSVTSRGKSSVSGAKVMPVPAGSVLAPAGSMDVRSKQGHLVGFCGAGCSCPGPCASWQSGQPQDDLVDLDAATAPDSRQHHPGGGTRSKPQNSARNRVRYERIVALDLSFKTIAILTISVAVSM